MTEDEMVAQGNRLSCRHQEGRRGSAEAVLGTSMFFSSETGMSGNFGSRGCIPGSPGESGLVSRGSQGLRSPLESRRGSLGAH